MYMYAWKKGIKTTYYLRSRPATKIAKTTVAVANRAVAEAQPVTYDSSKAIACSLDNPESCEACQ
jgi:ribonucleoside-diphosphate reductase alpha chain